MCCGPVQLRLHRSFHIAWLVPLNQLLLCCLWTLPLTQRGTPPPPNRGAPRPPLSKNNSPPPQKEPPPPPLKELLDPISWGTPMPAPLAWSSAVVAQLLCNHICCVSISTAGSQYQIPAPAGTSNLKSCPIQASAHMGSAFLHTYGYHPAIVYCFYPQTIPSKVHQLTA